MRKRREARMITIMRDENRTIQTNMRGILRYMQHNYEPIQLEEECEAPMGNAGFRTL